MLGGGFVVLAGFVEEVVELVLVFVGEDAEGAGQAVFGCVRGGTGAAFFGAGTGGELGVGLVGEDSSCGCRVIRTPSTLIVGIRVQVSG